MIDNQIDFLLYEKGEKIKIDGIDRVAIFQDASDKINLLDEKIMIVKDNITTGSIITYQNINWIVIGEIDNNFNNSKCRIRKSNYLMKIVLQESLYQFDIILDTEVLSVDNSSKFLSIIDGKVMITLQNNPNSKLISIDNRVILMQRAWKVLGVDSSILGILKLYMDSDLISDVNDDLINEIANKNLIVNYSVAITNKVATLPMTSTYPLTVNCTKNTIIDSAPIVTYSSSNPSIATVDNTGLVKGIVEGNVIIMVNYNKKAKGTMDLTITKTPVVDVFTYTLTSPIIPDTELKLGKTAIYTAKMLNNGVETAIQPAFDFVIVPSTPIPNYPDATSRNYTLTITGDNTCILKNVNYGVLVTIRAYLRADHTIYLDKIVKLKGSF